MTIVKMWGMVVEVGSICCLTVVTHRCSPLCSVSSSTYHVSMVLFAGMLLVDVVLEISDVHNGRL